MTVAAPAAESAAARPVPPTPDACAHPSPVLGVMAHEFSPYRDAQGPEGTRRTTMYYGPVVGGLPISAWHCEECGLLRLTYYDGRTEERRLYPGPQPGLLAVPLAEEVSAQARSGTYARVSGLSIPAELVRVLIPEPAPRRNPLRDVTLPDLGVAGWLTSLLLVAATVELTVLMIGAVAGSTTYGYEGGLAVAAGITFALAVATPVVGAAFAHFFPMPALQPSPAERYGGRPDMDGVAVALVSLLGTIALALTLAGILAIYDWRTPAVEYPLVIGIITVGIVATVVGIVGFFSRKLAHRP